MNETREKLLEKLHFVFLIDEITTYFSTIVCITGIIMNSILIYLILKKTPLSMKSYSVFLFNFAIFDLATCIIAFFACQKTMFCKYSLIYIFHGPCKYISPWFCYFCHVFECHTLAHSQWILLASFIYRYFVVVGKNPGVKNNILLSISLYSMSFVLLITYLLDIEDSKTLWKILTESYEYYHYDDKLIWGDLTISGNLSFYSPFTFGAILYMTIPCFPIYITILYCRHRTLKILSNPSLNISDNTKFAHRKLITALTIQAVIPIFWLTGACFFVLAQYGIISNPIQETMTFRFMDCLPMSSPIFSIVFISPYRQGFVEILKKAKFPMFMGQVGISTVDTTTVRRLDEATAFYTPVSERL
ncbi:unnamed protein product [Caenorhabditis angaria]|uniref:G-protein coupled receptors family 1 profile domain-containing protein n=1 Tax=Caenorhabditis angaria TaxID=860376 RepID=A0A9P1IEH8_9PELO|nr:unnamed protein product [Caenorhabditis angaria]